MKCYRIKSHWALVLRESPRCAVIVLGAKLKTLGRPSELGIGDSKRIPLCPKVSAGIREITK